MPVSAVTKDNPSRGEKEPTPEPTVVVVELRTPQARVLSVLMPTDPTTHHIEWPSMTSYQIAQALNTSTLSDLIRRAMRGLPEDCSSGKAHLGLLAKGCAVEYLLDVCGVNEIRYRITNKGITALTEYLKTHTLPTIRDAASCVNKRYKSTDPSTSSESVE